MDDPLNPHSSSPAELKARIELERSGGPFLQLRDGTGAQQLVRLELRERFVIGRDPEADVALVWDSEVSRVHAELHQLGGSWTIVDDGLSRNGTFVNSTRVLGRRRLSDRDRVRVGQTLIAFRAPTTEPQRSTSLTTRTVVPKRISDAQRRVLVALCQPCVDESASAAPATNVEIAATLVISVDSVKTHMRALFDAFGLHDAHQSVKRTRLVDLALSSGMVTRRDL